MKNKRINEVVKELLREEIVEHDKGKCNCDLAEGSYGLCYAGQWLEGCITSKQVIQDLRKVR